MSDKRKRNRTPGALPARSSLNPGDKVRLLTLDDLDGRTLAARRVKMLRQAIAEDLGGADILSTAQTQLAQRAAMLSAVLEHFEVQWAEGKGIELEEYSRAINALARVLGMLGLERRQREVVPDLRSYLRQKAEQAPADEEGDE